MSNTQITGVPKKERERTKKIRRNQIYDSSKVLRTEVHDQYQKNLPPMCPAK